MDNYWMEINETGKLHYVYQEQDGTRTVYEVLGFKDDESLNTRFLHKEKPKKNDEGEGSE